MSKVELERGRYLVEVECDVLSAQSIVAIGARVDGASVVRYASTAAKIKNSYVIF